MVQDLAWHFFQCRIPDDWECTNYNTDAKQGRLQFNTRHGLVATFHWRIVKHNIDELRMINEVHRRYLEREDEKRAAVFTELQHKNIGGFILAWDIPGEIAHATYFDRQHRIHLHWIFPDYSEDYEREILRPIVESFRENIDPMRYWALFGMGGYLPQTYAPVEIEAVPANVSLVFEGPRHHHVYLRRFGLPKLLIGESTMFGFYGNYQKKLRRRITGKRELTVLGMPAIQLDIEQRGEYAMEKLAGRWWRGTATIWLNEDEQRMYCFEQIGSKRVETLDMNDVIQAKT